MTVYVYDGSFEGLLTAVYEAFYRREKPDKIIQRNNLQMDLTAQYIYIDTDKEKSERVYNSIREKISVRALQNVYYVFLSEVEEAGTLIYNYLKFGWKVGPKVDLHMADDRVLTVLKIRRKVECEVHKMMGFVRFRLLEGDIYYAPIAPVHNIVELLAPHFAQRLADQNWVIYDERRNLAAVYNRREWVMTDTVPDRIPESGEGELLYQKLWKEFFNSIAISSRKNPKLQKRLMPVRYWRYLTEMQ